MFTYKLTHAKVQTLRNNIDAIRTQYCKIADLIHHKGIGKVMKVATYFKYMQTVMFETVVHGDDKGNVLTATRSKYINDGRYTNFK